MPVKVWAPPALTIRQEPTDWYPPKHTVKVDEGAVGDYKARHLIEWFNKGADGKIVWGGPGDLTACHAEAVKHMPSDKAWGFCNNRHRDVFGVFNDPDD